MRGGRRRKRARSGAPAKCHRYLRIRLPAEGAGNGTPLVFYPRYSTIVGDRFAENLIDVAAFAPATVPSPSGSSLDIHLVESDDPERGWGGRPTKPPRREGRRAATRRRIGREGPARKRMPARRRKTQGRSGGGRRA